MYIKIVSHIELPVQKLIRIIKDQSSPLKISSSNRNINMNTRLLVMLIIIAF